MHPCVKAFIVSTIVVLSFVIVHYTYNGTPSSSSASSSSSTETKGSENLQQQQQKQSGSLQDQEDATNVDPSRVAIVSVGTGLNETERLFRRYTWAAALKYCARHRYTCLEVAPPLLDVEDDTAAAAAAAESHVYEKETHDNHDEAHPGEFREGEDGEKQLLQEAAQTARERRDLHRASRRRQKSTDVCHAMNQALRRSSSSSSKKAFTHVLFLGVNTMLMNFNVTVQNLLHLSPRPLLIAPDFHGSLLLARKTDETKQLFRSCAAEGAARNRADVCAGAPPAVIQSLLGIQRCAAHQRLHVQVDPGFSGVYLAPAPGEHQSSEADDDDPAEEDTSSSSRNKNRKHIVPESVRLARTNLPKSKRFQPGKFAASFPHCGPRLRPDVLAVKSCIAQMSAALELSSRLNHNTIMVPLSIQKEEEEDDHAGDEHQQQQQSPEERPTLDPKTAHEAEEDRKLAQARLNASKVENLPDHDPMKQQQHQHAANGSGSASAFDDHGPTEAHHNQEADAVKHLKKSGFEEIGGKATSFAAATRSAAVNPVAAAASSSSAAHPGVTIYPERFMVGSAGDVSSTTPRLRIAILTLAEYPDSFRRRSYPEELVYRSIQLSWLNRARYAKKWGYDFILESGKAIDPSGARHPAYAKLGAILKTLKSGRYDWVFCMDADTLIMNNSQSLESHLLERAARIKKRQVQRLMKAASEAAPAAVSAAPAPAAGAGDDDVDDDFVDLSVPKKNSNSSKRIIDFKSFEHENFDVLITQDWNGINSGSFLVRKSSWSIDFFERANKMSPDDGACDGIPKAFWDQAILMCLLDPQRNRETGQEDLAHVKEFTTQRLFNSYGAPTHQDHAEALYQKGDFVLHMPNLKGHPRGFKNFKDYYRLAVQLNGGIPLKKAEKIEPPRTFYPDIDSFDRIVQATAETAAPGGENDPEETSRPPTPGEAAREFTARMRKRDTQRTHRTLKK